MKSNPISCFQTCIRLFGIILSLSNCSSGIQRVDPNPLDSARGDALSPPDSTEKEPSPSHPSDSPLSNNETLPNKTEMDRALRAGVLIPGMASRDVISIFGQPDAIDYAGNHKSENSRWTYENGLSDKWK